MHYTIILQCQRPQTMSFAQCLLPPPPVVVLALPCVAENDKDK